MLFYFQSNKIHREDKDITKEKEFGARYICWRYLQYQLLFFKNIAIYSTFNNILVLFSENNKVLINKTELDNVVYKNAKALRSIGLEPLLDLHAQLSSAIHSYASKLDRTKLPQELTAIVTRYLQHAKK